MEKKYILKSLKTPSETLLGRVMERISSEERKRLLFRKRVAVVSFIGIVISLLAMIPTFRMLQTGFSESGFWNFVALLFSDADVVFTYWQDFGLTLLESLPVMSLIAFLGAIFLFFRSLSLFMRDRKVFFRIS